MKIKLLIVSALILPLLIINNSINSTPTGAPSGRTGSPADGQTCISSGCHSGTSSVVTNIITTNVPSEGYTPNTEYTITITMGGSGKKGFEVSPQNANGNLLGTLTAGTGTFIVGTKYITHSLAKTASPAVWTFQWTSPAKGTGDVDFYGAFAITRSATKTQVLKVKEKTGTNLNEAMTFSAILFPNPVINELYISFNTLVKNASISIFDINGNEVLIQQFENSLENTLDLKALKNGNYFVKVIADNKVYNKKIAIIH
jgi:hypothetical protein